MRVIKAGALMCSVLEVRVLRHKEFDPHAQGHMSASGLQTQTVSSRVHVSLTHCALNVRAGIPSILLDSRHLSASGRMPCYIFSESSFQIKFCCKVISFYL